MAETRSSGYIGRAVPRLEDSRLLRGLGRYVDDLAAPPGTLHLAFLRSPHAHARIGSIRTAAAAAIPGVHVIATAADLAGLFTALRADYERPGFNRSEWYSIAVDRARYAGEIVAVAVADSPYVAEDVLELIEVEYAPLPAVVTVADAVKPGVASLHPNIGNVFFQGSFKSPGFDAAFAAAPVIVRETFTGSRIASAPMEPRGGLAVYDPGRDDLTYHATTQMPHIMRTAIAESFGWSESQIRIIAPDIGGGFGPKAYIYPEDILSIALARKLERPVKWFCDRMEDLQTTLQARDHRFDGELALDRQGIIQALRVRIEVNAGAYAGYPFGSSIEAAGGAVMMPGPYRLKYYAYEARSIATNVCPAGAYRGVSQPTAFFVMEGLLDRAAAKLGLDPAEIRLRNILHADEFPYTNAIGIRYDIGSYEECLKRALALGDYAGYRSRQTPTRFVEGKYRGVGIACFTEHTGQGASRYRDRGIRRMPGYDSAVVKVLPGGKAAAYVSQTEIGQGSITTCAQIVADRLGLDINDVTIVEGDTSLTPHGSGTGASRGAVAAGGAVLRAADKVREKMLRIAGDFLEASPKDIELNDGYAHVAGAPQLRVAIAEIAAVAHAAHDRPPPKGHGFGLEATDHYDPPHVYITNATHLAWVAVDPATGLVSVERYLVVHDCGRVINPLVVEGQIHGAVAQGLGQALMERIVHGADGQQQTVHFLDYLLPTALDLPPIEIAHLETPSPETAGGFKGVGEGGVIGALPALANAVADALKSFNANINRLPLAPDHVLDLIDQHRDRRVTAA